MTELAGDGANTLNSSGLMGIVCGVRVAQALFIHLGVHHLERHAHSRDCPMDICFKLVT